MELEPHLQAIAHGQGPRNLDTLRSGAGIFSALSLEHIALEESVVYPQAKSRLNGLAAGNEGRLAAMQSRSMRQQSSQP